MGLDGHPWSRLAFDGVLVSYGDQIAGPDLAAKLLDRAYDSGRLHLAAEMLGCAQEAFDRAVDYLKTRVQFGRKIGEFQALQHRAAILLGELEIARSVVMKAAALWDAGEAAAPEYVSLAKARVGQIACHVTTEAVQFHGGIGVTDEFDIGLFLKRARAAAEQLGDSAFHTERYARMQGL
jgi:acyl-CoA dehydrogenase